MDNQGNTIAMMVLAGLASALGLSIASGMVFHNERPEKMGYPIAGVVEESEGGEAEEAVIPIGVMMASADVTAGAEVFKKCASCHSIAQGGATSIGPNLWGILGKPHGGVPGFAYSDALKGVAGNWNFDNMNAWLISPRKYAPGTKMSFAGLSNPADRANVIAYVNSNGSNLPLPAVEAAPSPETQAAESGPPTADLANQATPNAGAPSIDENAAEEAKKAGL